MLYFSFTEGARRPPAPPAGVRVACRHAPVPSSRRPSPPPEARLQDGSVPLPRRRPRLAAAPGPARGWVLDCLTAWTAVGRPTPDLLLLRLRRP